MSPWCCWLWFLLFLHCLLVCLEVWFHERVFGTKRITCKHCLTHVHTIINQGSYDLSEAKTVRLSGQKMSGRPSVTLGRLVVKVLECFWGIYRGHIWTVFFVCSTCLFVCLFVCVCVCVCVVCVRGRVRARARLCKAGLGVGEGSDIHYLKRVVATGRCFKQHQDKRLVTVLCF